MIRMDCGGQVEVGLLGHLSYADNGQITVSRFRGRIGILTLV